MRERGRSMLRWVFVLVGLAGLMLIPACKSNKYKYTDPPKSYTRRIAPSSNVVQATSAPTSKRAAPPTRATLAPAVTAAAKPEPVKPVTLSSAVPSPQASAPTLKPRPKFTNASTLEGKDDPTVYRLRSGDPIVVYLRGIPGVPGGEQVIEDVVDENGGINMPYVNELLLGGKTPTEAENIIHSAYIDQKIYKFITVNVVVPARSYYVRGEVKQPGRFPLVTGVTVIQAIAASGGFTEFANPKKVEILRGTKRVSISVRELEKYPERDIAVKSGDVIIVQRSFF